MTAQCFFLQWRAHTLPHIQLLQLIYCKRQSWFYEMTHIPKRIQNYHKWYQQSQEMISKFVIMDQTLAPAQITQST